MDLRAPVFPAVKKDKPKCSNSEELPKNGKEVQKNIKSIINKLNGKASSSLASELSSIVKKGILLWNASQLIFSEARACEVIFRQSSILGDLITLIDANASNRSIKRELYYTLSMICTNDKKNLNV